MFEVICVCVFAHELPRWLRQLTASAAHPGASKGMPMHRCGMQCEFCYSQTSLLALMWPCFVSARPAKYAGSGFLLLFQGITSLTFQAWWLFRSSVNHRAWLPLQRTAWSDSNIASKHDATSNQKGQQKGPNSHNSSSPEGFRKPVSTWSVASSTWLKILVLRVAFAFSSNVFKWQSCADTAQNGYGA
eukprot:1154061-Pelagomonas_calceolata.AAC.7